MIFLSLITQVSTLQSENGTPNKSNKRQARTGGETTTPFSRLMLAATVACAVLCIIAFFCRLRSFLYMTHFRRRKCDGTCGRFGTWMDVVGF